MIEYSFESDDDDIPLSVIQSKLSPDKHNLHSESCADVDIAVNKGEDDSGVGGGDDDEVDNENDDIPLSVLKQKLSVKDILETAATSGILLDIDNDVVTGDDPFLCNATIPINQNTDGVYECDNSISCPNNIPCNSINNTTIDVHENQSSYSVTFEVGQNDISVTHPQIFPDITESSRPSVSVTDTTLPTSSDNTFTDLHVYQPNYSVIGADISESSFSPGGHLLFSNNDAVSSWPNQNPQIGSVCELYDSYSAIEAAQCSRDIVSDEVSHANPTDVIGDPCSTSIDSPEVSHSEADNLVDDSSRSRLRFRNVTNWKRNIQKRLRNSGQEYTAHTGKRVCARQMIYHQCRCNMDCSKHFSLEERQDIFSKYWNLGSYERQRDFIKAHVTKIGKKRATVTGNSRRENTIIYNLPKHCDKQRVCKDVFLKTLDVGEKTVAYTLVKRQSIDSQDGRGKGAVPGAITEEDKNIIRTHIASFPAVESHYCRKSSNRKYLESGLSIGTMYRMYVEECKTKDRTPVKKHVYQSIFSGEFNLGFHVPKKDKCAFCETYNNMSNEDQVKSKEQYDSHIRRKVAARLKKQTDKNRAVLHNNIAAVNFDLQKVLVTPKCNVSDFYYSRKLSTYNLSVYNMATREAKCYMWHEGEGKRGSCEISTCLYKYNVSLGAKDEVIYYSDSCTGQQRNSAFSAMCLYSVVNLPINTITHNYFERGHSQMEGDSVHATIERAVKHVDVFAPSEWYTAVSMAKKSVPAYRVHELKHTNFLNFKDLVCNTVSNLQWCDNDTKIRWNKIHCFQYRKESPTNIFFKYDIADSEFMSLNILLSRGRRRRQMADMHNYPLKAAYGKAVPIGMLKYQDLAALCSKGLIPTKYHEFYAKLPCSIASRERLAEPNEDEDSD